MGGLSKKAYQLEKIRGLHELPYLTVDGGNLLFKHDRLSAALMPQAKISAAGIIDSYNLMNFDAVAVGRHDLAAGLSFLKEQTARSTFIWLSANLLSKSTEKNIFSASLLRKAGNISVGIIGLTDHNANRLLKENDDAFLLPWQKALPGLVADLSAKCDLIILLSNYPPKENKAIAESFAEIHIIIQSTPRAGNINPQLHNESLIAQTGKQGKYLGWMSVNWQMSKMWAREGASKELAAKKSELDGLNGRINRLERRTDKMGLSADRRYQSLLASREQLFSEIIFLENELFELRESGLIPSTFENHFVALDVNLPDQPDVKKISDAIKSQVNLAGRSKADQSAASPGISRLQMEKLAFTGWQVCRSCHPSQTEFWGRTDHASAFQSLVEQDQQFNLDCLPCHVTGAYKDRKISDDDAVLLSLPAELQQVGCEACHGPAKKHAVTENPADISLEPGKSICLSCHTAERDEEFNYTNEVERIACPASKN